jgi:hypothetical protein
VEQRAALVGATVGLLAWFAPGVVGGGDAITQQTLGGREVLSMLGLAFVLRLALGPVSYAARTPGEVAGRVAQDLAGAFRLKPHSPPTDRLRHADFQKLCGLLSVAGMELSDSEETEQKLAQLRGTYEPYVYTLSQFLFVELPPWIKDIPPAMTISGPGRGTAFLTVARLRGNALISRTPER